MPWTSDDLLTGAKLTAFWPPSNGKFTDAELLQLADRDLQSRVFPKILKANGSWRVADDDQSITANQELYRIPPRAHAGRLKDVLYVNSDGEESSLDYIDLEEGRLLAHGRTAGSRDFFFKDGHIGFYSVPTSTQGTLRQRYYMRPGTLVVQADAAQITTIGAADSGGAGFRRFTCGTVPSTWTTSSELDFIRKDGSFETTHIDLAVNAIVTGAGGTIDIAETSLDTSLIQVGDWIALATESPIPQIPDAVHPWLEHRLACRMLQAQGDRENWKIAKAEADDIEKSLKGLLQPRDDAESSIIVPRNAPLPMRSVMGLPQGWR